jgi:hypothetical protein
MFVRNDHLDFWIRNNLNVLFVGHAGIGKTSIVKDAFERHGLKWRYYSAATMDPWVDLVGVPQKVEDDKGNVYLELIRPKDFQNDEVECLFFDEFNRAHKKVRNAVMELLQFKSINGKKFNNLRFIWAAVNPADDGNYDVEPLDPAQEDRFQIHVHAPYEADKGYFTKKYGETLAKSALAWWGELPKEVKMKVTPRRLDYALEVFQKDGDIRFVLPSNSNVNKLLTTIKHGPVSEALTKLMEKNDVQGATAFLAVENNYAAAEPFILKRKDRIEFFLPLMPNEKVSSLFASNDMAYDVVMKNIEKANFKQIVLDILQANTNKLRVNRIKREVKKDDKLGNILGLNGPKLEQFCLGINPEPSWWNKKADEKDYDKYLTAWEDFFKGKKYHTTQDRRGIYKRLREDFPEKITTAQAVRTLSILDTIASNSQASTLQNLKDFVGIVNHCLRTIAEKEKMVHDDIVKTYRKNFHNLLRKFEFDAVLGKGLFVAGKNIEKAQEKEKVKGKAK